MADYQARGESKSENPFQHFNTHITHVKRREPLHRRSEVLRAPESDNLRSEIKPLRCRNQDHHQYNAKSDLVFTRGKQDEEEKQRAQDQLGDFPILEIESVLLRHLVA